MDLSRGMLACKGRDHLGAPLVQSAYRFAQSEHQRAGHARRYTGEDYTVHLLAIAGTVASVPDHTPQWLAAALLHGVLVHTEVTEEQVAERFGADVAGLVKEVLVEPGTDTYIDKHALRRWRERLARASTAAQTIHAAHVLDNVTTLVERDPDFACRYLPRKRDDVVVLDRVDDRLKTWTLRTIEMGLGLVRLPPPPKRIRRCRR